MNHGLELDVSFQASSEPGLAVIFREYRVRFASDLDSSYLYIYTDVIAYRSSRSNFLEGSFLSNNDY